METTTFATVLRSSEVSLHILVQKGTCMSFPCFTVGLSRFTVWMKVKREGRKGSILGVVFRHFVQKNHHFENQPIKQNDGLTI